MSDIGRLPVTRNDTINALRAQRNRLDELVSRFCAAVGEPIPVDAIERAVSLRSRVEEAVRIFERGKPALEEAMDTISVRDPAMQLLAAFADEIDAFLERYAALKS